MKSLSEAVPEILLHLEERGVAVVTAPPGTGKSTVLPLALLESMPGGGKIVMLEPRRIAARQIASRMASTLGEPVGRTVGYRIRFERRVSASTRIEVLTEGLLTRSLVDDPALEGVSLVIFDEFHERGLNSDLALAMTRSARELLRPDLKILIMSATIDAESLCSRLNAARIDCGARQFPVQIEYSDQDTTPENVVERVSAAVRKAHASASGDILAFLPGEGEIRRCAEALTGLPETTRIYPLYGMLPDKLQKEAIAPAAPGLRKIVLATPVAETSLTIEGVKIVVDSGLCRRPVYNPHTELERLDTVRISMDMAVQRAGRAGRVAPGICFRLWNKASERRMDAMRSPEILTADLCSTVLQVAAFGERAEDLPWLDPPPQRALDAACQLLCGLGALDEERKLTRYGRRLAAFPCHPRIAQMLLKAQTPEEKALASDIAALIEAKDPLGDDAGCSLELRLRNIGAWGRIRRAAEQYRALAGVSDEAAFVDPYVAGALVASAYPGRIAKAWGEGAGRYCLPDGSIVAMRPDDPLCGARWLAIASLGIKPGGVGSIFLAAPLDESDLEPFARERDLISWDAKAGAVIARREKRIGALLISSQPLNDCSDDDVLDVLCAAAPRDGRSMFDFSDECANLQRRIACVSAWHPELELPDVSTDALLAGAGKWLPAFRNGASSTARLKKIDMCAVVWSLLDYQQQAAVDRIAPSHITVPTGSRIRLEYRQGAEAPVLRVRLQECFGMQESPKVDEGTRPVLMELLSPGFKPVQLTTDLRSFWRGTYFEVRKELRRRYPKHSWPEDPLAAAPVRGTVRKPSI